MISIVVVDDDIDILNLLKKILTKHNYRVHIFERPKEAFTYIKNHKPHITILDIIMPELNGIDLLKKIKTEFPDIHPIILTGNATLENTISALQNGAENFIQKPFNVSELLNIIEKVGRTIITQIKEQSLIPYLKNVTYQFIFDNEASYFNLVCKVISDHLKGLKFCKEKIINTIILAVEEAMINAIDHGNLELQSEYQNGILQNLDEYKTLRKQRLKNNLYKNRQIIMELEMNPDYFKCTITDEGKGFNWRELPKNDLEKYIKKGFGKGAFLIHTFMDRVEFNAKGNQIKLIKYSNNNSHPYPHEIKNAANF